MSEFSDFSTDCKPEHKPDDDCPKESVCIDAYRVYDSCGELYCAR